MSAISNSGHFFCAVIAGHGDNGSLETFAGVLMYIDKAIAGWGGGMATIAARRLRFCTMAVGRNSSRAPALSRYAVSIRAALETGEQRELFWSK